MNFVETGGARVFWHEFGRGEPIILIMGLGCSSAMWFRIAPRLARHCRVILLDNRGAGRTQVERFVTHRITSMAADVAAVLDAAKETSAHVVGFSMGGMIAQQMALDYPQRVRSLVLLGTSCGGPHAILAERKVTDLLFEKGKMAPELALKVMQPYVYARDTPAQLIGEDNAVRLATTPSLRDFKGQLFGLMAWSSYWHLPDIRVPTLIVHGIDDQLIPAENGRLLANRIPGARLIELPGASHWLHTDQPDALAANVLEFIALSPR